MKGPLILLLNLFVFFPNFQPKIINYTGYDLILGKNKVTLKSNNKTLMIYEGLYDINQLEHNEIINAIVSNKKNYKISDNNLFFSEVHFPKMKENMLVENVFSYQQSYFLKDVPEYFNYPISPIDNGCTPTSATMMLSYFNNNAINGLNLYKQKMPLKHYDNKKLVDDKIVEMADYMNTNSLGDGTFAPIQSNLGINLFLNRNELRQDVDFFSSYTYSSFDDYCFAIIKGQSPSICNLKGHSVLGYGFSNFNGNSYIMSKSTWTGSEYEGNYFVERTLCQNYQTLINYNTII